MNVSILGPKRAIFWDDSVTSMVKLVSPWVP